MKKIIFFLILMSIFTFNGHAFSQTKVKIVHIGSDNIGERLSYDVKELVNLSSRFTLIENTEEPHAVVLIETMAKDPDNPQWASIFSIIVLLKGKNMPAFYVDSTIGFTGINTVSTSAKNIMSRIASILESNSLVNN